mgnify:CR=1 FL=1
MSVHVSGWAARLKLMVNHMGYSKGAYASSEFGEIHTERVTRQDVMSTDFMPKARLDEVRAAFALPVLAADSMPSREELAKLLLAGSRAWDRGLLQAHRAAVGGKWRDVHKLKKKPHPSQKRPREETVAGTGAGPS